MRHVFQSRSLFHEARLLRFDGTDQPSKEPPHTPEVADTVEEFRQLEKDGIAGPEKVAALDAKVKQVEGQCKDMLKQMKERAGKNPAWNEMYDRYYQEMQQIHMTTEGQQKIDALLSTLNRLQGEATAQALKPRERLEGKQMQEFDNLSAAQQDVTNAVAAGKGVEEIDAALRIVNEQLGGADPAVRTAWYDQFRVEVGGRNVVAPDGTRYTFLVNENGTLFYETSKQPEAGENQQPREAADAEPVTSDALVAQAKFMVDEIRSHGDEIETAANLGKLNDMLRSADPAVSKAWLEQYRMNREGTNVISPDGVRYSFRVAADNTLTYERLVVEKKDAPDAQPEQDAGAGKRELVKNFEKFADNIGAAFDKMIKDPSVLQNAAKEFKAMLENLSPVIQKHGETLTLLEQSGIPMEELGKLFTAKDNAEFDAALGALTGKYPDKMTDELELGLRALRADIVAAMEKGIAVLEQKVDDGTAGAAVPQGEAPAANGAEAPKEAAKGDLVEQARDKLSKKVEMTEAQKEKIVADGKKLLEEYKKIDAPTDAQTDQVRGQLMMAGVDATAGVEALAKDPDNIKPKEGTQLQVTLNKVMGFVIYVMSMLQEIRDTVKGAEKKETTATPERTRETARAEIDGHVQELTRLNQADELSASGNGAALLATLNESTAAYVKEFGGEPDITRSVTDGAGTLHDLDSGSFVTVAYDIETKTYSFVPAEGEQAEPDEAAPEQSREQALEAAKQKTDAAIIDADATVDLDADERRPAIEAALKAIDEEQSLMNEGELSSEDMVKRMEDLTAKADSYRADLAALDEDAAEDEGEIPEEESIEALKAQSDGIQQELDALDDRKAEELPDEDLDAIKVLRAKKRDIDQRIADMEAKN